MTLQEAEFVARKYVHDKYQLTLGRVLASKLVMMNDPFALSFQLHDSWILNFELITDTVVARLEDNTLYVYVDTVTHTARLAIADTQDEHI